MSEPVDPNRPSWPGAKPAWETPAAPATPTEAVPDAPARPGWDAPSPAPGARGRRLRDIGIDLKLVIAVLIGLASVTGAVITWRSAQLGERATDKDRQAIAETVLVAQGETQDEVTVQDARVRFAEHAVAQVAATELRRQADEFAAAGRIEDADVAREEAVEQQAIADRVLSGGPSGNIFLGAFIDTGPDGAPSFRESDFRDVLADLRTAGAEVSPTQTFKEADQLRQDSQRLVGWLIGVVGAVALFTMAQINRAKLVRLGLLGAATCLWVVSAVMAYGGS